MESFLGKPESGRAGAKPDPMPTPMPIPIPAPMPVPSDVRVPGREARGNAPTDIWWGRTIL